MNQFFVELAVILMLAGAVSFFVSLLKQPSIIAYIITGLIVGPFGYYRLEQSDVFSALAQIGIALLLFMVGMELDVSQLKKLGRNALLAGMGQIIFTTAAGFGLLRLLDFSEITSLYLAFALTLSSTIIVVKLLGEKKDLQSLYGRLAVGIFLTQDLFVILVLISLSTLSHGGQNFYSSLPLWQSLIMALVRALVLILVVWWASAKVLPKILRTIGHNEELMLIFSLAWALGLATFVSLPLVGFSLEIGGFLAGLALGKSGLHYEISGKIKPIRDFFIMIFFIILGSGIVLNNLPQMLLPALLLSAFVLIGKPLIVMILLGLFGYKPRTGLLTGSTVAQVSEFSLILTASGVALGHLKPAEASFITLVAVVTIALSSYMIMHTTAVYERLKDWLQIFDFRKGLAEKHTHTAVLKNHIVLVGAHRLGHHLVDSLKKQKTPFIIVDFDPEVAEKYAGQNLPVICGDITDDFIQERVNLPFAKMVISTVPDFKDNLRLLHSIRRHAGKRRAVPKLIFMAQDEVETKALYENGVDYVISPHFMGGLHLAKILGGKDSSFGLKKLRENHLEILLDQKHA